MPATLERTRTLPESDSLYEIVYGVRVEKPMSARASLAASRLSMMLCEFVDRNDRGMVVREAIFLFDALRDLRLRPSVAFVSTDRWPLSREVPDVEEWEVIPDLAAEAVTLNDSMERLIRKISNYFESGVRQVWIVLPCQQQVYIYDSPTRLRVLQRGDELSGGRLLPGFRIAVSAIFSRKPGTRSPTSKPSKR